MKNIVEIFKKSIIDYHTEDSVDAKLQSPFEANSFDHLLYHKCWVDSVQWHLEDLIRDPNIDPTVALQLKRRIDSSNQLRTDLVERIDDVYLELFKAVKPNDKAIINTESPAWALDRLSILQLKIYHMRIETKRTGSSSEHLEKCVGKLGILLEQDRDLSSAIEMLLDDLRNGTKRMKVYRQMKMYNDPLLNPVIYGQPK